jgi:hypothetical protein
MTLRTRTEYEVCTVDSNGDIVDVDHYSTKSKALKAANAAQEVWRVVWKVEVYDGVEDSMSAYRESETLIAAPA